jgi:hypothetical protein
MRKTAARIALVTSMVLAVVMVATNAASAASTTPPASSHGHSSPRDSGPRHVKRQRAPFGGIDERSGDVENESAASSASLTIPIYYKSNGWIQQTPRVYIVYWGNWSGDVYGEMNQLWYFYQGIGGSSWNNTQTQYGMNCVVGTTNCTSNSTMIRNVAGQAPKYVFDTTAPPSTSPTEAQMAAEARWAASYFGDTGVEAQYIIALPRGYRDAKSIAKTWCAWHNYTTSNNGYMISYTSMPYIPDMATTCGMNRVNAGAAGYLDGVSIYAGHEYAESETDPFLNSWADANGDENADKCLQYNLGSGWFANVTLSNGRTFAVQPEWSNKSFLAGGSPCFFWS